MESAEWVGRIQGVVNCPAQRVSVRSSAGQKPSASLAPPRPSWGRARGSTCRPRLVAAGEGAVGSCVPGQPIPVFSLLTSEASGWTAYLKTL